MKFMGRETFNSNCLGGMRGKKSEYRKAIESLSVGEGVMFTSGDFNHGPSPNNNQCLPTRVRAVTTKLNSECVGMFTTTTAVKPPFIVGVMRVL